MRISEPNFGAHHDAEIDGIYPDFKPIDPKDIRYNNQPEGTYKLPLPPIPDFPRVESPQYVKEIKVGPRQRAEQQPVANRPIVKGFLNKIGVLR